MSAILGVTETNCNECRRRKGKCDRLLPECSSCARNRRHCLYEKAAGRTPLTRKNLTEVEEKLRRAETRVRVAERRAIAAEEKLAAFMQSASSHQFSAPEPAARPPSNPNDKESGFLNFGVDQESANHTELSGSHSAAVSALPSSHQFNFLQTDDIYSGLPEDPPSETDDFSWDEITHATPSTRPETTNAHDQSLETREEDVVDGMASLTVEERGTGYLGTASGAAMLRLLLPDAEHRNMTRSRRKTNSDEAAAQESELQTHERSCLTDVDLDSAINSYFSSYHLQYPLVHEPTFRAQYAQIIPRPNGKIFEALIYMIGAIGLFATATASDAKSSDDLKLFEAAKRNISIEILEKGNITLVQVLVLMSNYLQKRGKPNSGYNYLGLALHMAMGLGLHKEFVNWKISPLAIENRRRVWWTLFNFFAGALVTFGRPWSWPERGIEISLPLNVHDGDLTNATKLLPESRQTVTTYSFMLAQASFHKATAEIYTRVISMPYPSAQELLDLDDERLNGWLSSLGPWYSERAQVPSKFALGHHIMFNRFRNFRIIMYRPYVIRSVLDAARGFDRQSPSPAEQNAIDRCLHEAKATIFSIRAYWSNGVHNKLAAWYALYFLFQATLIPCLCLRNQPTAPLAADWQLQIKQTLLIMAEMNLINPSSIECQNVIMRLCGQFIDPVTSMANNSSLPLEATEESPQTQINNVYSMMWPSSTTPISADLLMSDPSWETLIANAGPVDLESMPQNWDWT